jgi:hypothetical protein
MTYKLCTDPKVLEASKKIWECEHPVIQPLKSDEGTIFEDGIIATERSGMSWVRGNVNMGNRIFTDGHVEIVTSSVFIIKPSPTSTISKNQQSLLLSMSQFYGKIALAGPTTTSNASVKATIDGTEYEGEQIVFHNGKVSVTEVPAQTFQP